jgi:hypothetical protein
VDRFTGLLYSKGRAPKVTTRDRAGQPWMDAALKEMRWSPKWGLARSYGGRIGSVVTVVRLRDGEPRLDVINAKWCTPRWKNGDRTSGELEGLEVLYRRPFGRYQMIKDPRTGAQVRAFVEGEEWYRRTLTDQTDVVETAVIDKDKPIVWVPQDAYEHGLGFVPAEWVQNTETSDCDDGEPDCAGKLDDFDALDGLYSDAFQGTHYNADPTPWIKSNRPLGDVLLGSGTVVGLRESEEMGLLELHGSGGEAAAHRAAELRDAILEDVRCVLSSDLEQTSAKTATQVLKREGAMLERADELRQQYGAAMERLAEKFLRMCVKVGWENVTEFRQADEDPDSPTKGKIIVLTPPTDIDVTVDWPDYAQATEADKELRVRKFAEARTALPPLVSQRTAIRALQHDLGIEDVDREMAEIEKEQAGKAERDALAFGLGTGGDGTDGDAEDKPVDEKGEGDEPAGG